MNRVFGIQSAGTWEKKTVNVKGAGPLKGLDIKADFVETGVTPTTAEVIGTADGKPAVFVNRFGKGKAVYFAASAVCTFGDWKEMRYSKNNLLSSRTLLGYIDGFFKEKGIRPFVLAPTLRGTTLYLRESGNALILGTVRDLAQTSMLGDKKETHVIKLAGKRHVYDMLHHRYLGYGDSFKYEYTPTTQAVFALLPYKAKGIEVEFKPDGAELTLLADTDRFADHTFHVELIDDKGKINPAFNDVVPGKGTKAFYRFRKPLNARSKWKLQVREALTSATKTVELP